MRVLIVAALTMSVVSTLGTPLIPDIASEKHVSLEDAQWMLTVTMLVGAIATPVIGRLGDGSRRKRVLIVTLATVLVGLVITASAGSFAQMLLGRGIQGVGYGTVPLTIVYARHHLGPALQQRTIAALSVTVAVGAGLGFPITGLIAQLFDFHVAFWFGALCCAASLAAVALLLPSDSGADHKVRVDYVGAAMLGAGLTALLVAISRGESWGWSSNQVLGLLGASAVLLIGWGWFEMRSADPIIDLRLSAKPAVLGANTGALLMGAGMYIGLSLVNRLVQTPTSTGYGFGASLFVAGLVLLPLSFGSLAAQPIALDGDGAQGRAHRPARRRIRGRHHPRGRVSDPRSPLRAVCHHRDAGGRDRYDLRRDASLDRLPRSPFESWERNEHESGPAQRRRSPRERDRGIGPRGEDAARLHLSGERRVHARVHHRQRTVCRRRGGRVALVPARRAQRVKDGELALLMQESGTSAGVGPSIFDGEFDGEDGE